MDQTRKEQMLGSVVFLSRALLTSFCFPLERCFALTLVSVSPIPFHELSCLVPGYFLGLLCSLHPCPVLHPSALATDFLVLSVPLILKCCPKMLGHRSGLLDAAVIPIYWWSKERGLLPQYESTGIVKALGNWFPQQRVSNESFMAPHTAVG